MKNKKALYQILWAFFFIFKPIESFAVPKYIFLDFEKFKIEEQRQGELESDVTQPLNRWSNHTSDSSLSSGQDWTFRKVGQKSQIIEYKFDVLGISFIPFHFKGHKSYSSLNRLIDRKISQKCFDKVILIVNDEIKNENNEFRKLVEEDLENEIELLSYLLGNEEDANESPSSHRLDRGNSILSMLNIDSLLSRVGSDTLIIYADKSKWNLINFRKRLDLSNSLKEGEFEESY